MKDKRVRKSEIKKKEKENKRHKGNKVRDIKERGVNKWMAKKKER
jgi:hypothetical protein